VSGADVIVIQRRLPAPTAEVFRWWTRADLLRQWMAPVGTVEAEVDLRVGGALRIVMRGEGMVIEHVGEFTEIEEPRRLAFTWSSPYTGGRPSSVTLSLEPDGEGATFLRLVHSDLPASAADSHRGGWSAILLRLEGAMSPDPGLHGPALEVEADNGH
jgi:uncharacterized protein YndB with AHSA1/START domain